MSHIIPIPTDSSPAVAKAIHRFNDKMQELRPVPAKDLLNEALSHLYRGMDFMRLGLPADTLDKEHLTAAHAILEQVAKAQR